MDKKQKILVIIGPTASGKTALSIALARRLNGEIISADSRQIYRGFDATTVKITREEMDGIPHHLLDVADIGKRLSVAEYREMANAAIRDISSRGKLPILCGGTGYYIDAVLYDRTFPEVLENTQLRKELEEKGAKELYDILLSLDQARAETIEKENPRRLIRAIEIATALGKVPEAQFSYESKYDALILGLRPSETMLQDHIKKRIALRIDMMIEEIKSAYDSGVLTEARADELGFDFSLCVTFLKDEIDKNELAKRLEYGDVQYTKRQMRWFKRNPNIIWFESADIAEITEEIKRWGLLS
jgi:tRNA dimethylallyltransferase